jgi:proteasome lid subunit RPN8/RPN11
VVYITRGLLEVLVDLARKGDPEEVTAALAVTPAGELDGAAVGPETQVFTDFYLPETGGSVAAVFGVDLATPPGQTQGRFVSHPRGEQGVSRTDDLHEVVFVAVPPWGPDQVRAYDRSGRRQTLTVLDVEPAPGSLAE